MVITYIILSMYVQRIPSAPTYPYTDACLPQNVGYNRFRNIYPCKTIYRCQHNYWLKTFNFFNTDDNSRVCLRAIPGVIGSDYINASFISVRIHWRQILLLMIFKFCYIGLSRKLLYCSTRFINFITNLIFSIIVIFSL